ncbi:MAG: ribosome biogenesis GTPase Der [Candidatus Didemnitutus sp.]|jgi:GTP-binding protein|nr:ribosome biogenesis GTPase Der [Candidatus Didemnitutus sp.]
MSRTVAIVGRPNVGKSRLFNRLAKRRVSIVHDQPGVTRDIVSVEVKDGGYTLLDTGGLGLQDANTPTKLIKASEAQVEFAIRAASVICFVVDAKEGLTSLDERIAGMLRKSKKSIILVANKADHGEEKVGSIEELYRLGFGEPIFVSAEHGNGEAPLRNAILDKLPPAEIEPEDHDKKRLTLCFVGRPNVGKSSLSNRLLKSQRLIVSDVPGTTRDSVELSFDYKARDGKVWPFRLIDTAGIRAATKLSSSVEYFSRVRSIDAIHQADVVFMVLDAMDGVTQQDKAIAGEIVAAGRPIVVIVNKWDLVYAALRRGELKQYKGERDFREKFEKALYDRLFFTPGAPVMFVSALTGHDIERMLKATRALDERLGRKIPTGKLNAAIVSLTDRTPPPSVGGQRFRAYYATQTGNRPFRIKVFCNREEKLTEQYRRYLEGGLVEEFGLEGCPIHFELVGKKKISIDDRLARRGQKRNAADGTDAGDEVEFDPSLLDD